MRKLPVILTLLLTAVWMYTCWYWYTCNIKGFCDESASYVVSSTENDNISQWDVIVTSTSQETWADNTNLGEASSSPTLSAEDVLFDSLPKEIEQEDATLSDDQTGEEASEDSAWTWSTDSREADEEVNNSNKTEEVEVKQLSICDNPIVWPIVFGGENKKQEVEYLEVFLISRGEDLNIDRIYWEDDFEAMKRFQLEYKAEVLDPWGITTPTGYVWKTSVAKINEIACK